MFTKLRSFFFLGLIILGLGVGLYLLDKRVSFFSRASGISANIVVDASFSKTASNPWQNLAQGGEEQGRSLSTVITETKNLEPQYIRIDHIYDFHNVVGRNPSGSLTFDWSRLDQVVDDILATNAKPFFALSYMPAAISKSNEVDLPRNWGEWQQVVRATIEHYSGKTNKGLEDIYYEVWNEPDLFGNFKIYGEKNYFDLYKYANFGAREAVNTLPFKLGGPATTALYENWYVKFLEFIDQENLRIDFYSWHHYTMELEDYEKDIANVRSWAERVPQKFVDLELIISEMGHDSKNHSGYDEKFGAIHTLATASVLEGEINRGFNFEIKDGPGPQKLWGRWGILTHEKYGTPEKKPRYQALEFLKFLRGRALNIAGEGSWVKAIARQENGAIRVLIVNYDSSGKHAESVPLSVQNLPQDSYLYRKREFLGTSRERVITASDSAFTILEYFAPNSASILELIPR